MFNLLLFSISFALIPIPEFKISILLFESALNSTAEIPNFLDPSSLIFEFIILKFSNEKIVLYSAI